MKEKQSGLKMSLECTWDRAAALTRVSRAIAQRIISKKVELPSLSIDEAPTVTKVTLDDFDQGVSRRTIAIEVYCMFYLCISGKRMVIIHAGFECGFIPGVGEIFIFFYIFFDFFLLFFLIGFVRWWKIKARKEK